MPLEKLHGALVLRRRGTAPKSAEIAPPAGLRIFLAGIEPVFAGGELADHGGGSRKCAAFTRQRCSKRFVPLQTTPPRGPSSCPARRAPRYDRADQVRHPDQTSTQKSYAALAKRGLLAPPPRHTAPELLGHCAMRRQCRRQPRNSREDRETRYR